MTSKKPTIPPRPLPQRVSAPCPVDRRDGAPRGSSSRPSPPPPSSFFSSPPGPPPSPRPPPPPPPPPAHAASQLGLFDGGCGRRLQRLEHAGVAGLHAGDAVVGVPAKADAVTNNIVARGVVAEVDADARLGFVSVYVQEGAFSYAQTVYRSTASSPFDVVVASPDPSRSPATPPILPPAGLDCSGHGVCEPLSGTCSRGVVRAPKGGAAWAPGFGPGPPAADFDPAQDDGLRVAGARCTSSAQCPGTEVCLGNWNVACGSDPSACEIASTTGARCRCESGWAGVHCDRRTLCVPAGRNDQGAEVTSIVARGATRRALRSMGDKRVRAGACALPPPPVHGCVDDANVVRTRRKTGLFSARPAWIAVGRRALARRGRVRPGRDGPRGSTEPAVLDRPRLLPGDGPGRRSRPAVAGPVPRRLRAAPRPVRGRTCEPKIPAAQCDAIVGCAFFAGARPPACSGLDLDACERGAGRAAGNGCAWGPKYCDAAGGFGSMFTLCRGDDDRPGPSRCTVVDREGGGTIRCAAARARTRSWRGACAKLDGVQERAPTPARSTRRHGLCSSTTERPCNHDEECPGAERCRPGARTEEADRASTVVSERGTSCFGSLASQTAADGPAVPGERLLRPVPRRGDRGVARRDVRRARRGRRRGRAVRRARDQCAQRGARTRHRARCPSPTVRRGSGSADPLDAGGGHRPCAPADGPVRRRRRASDVGRRRASTRRPSRTDDAIALEGVASASAPSVPMGRRRGPRWSCLPRSPPPACALGRRQRLRTTRRPSQPHVRRDGAAAAASVTASKKSVPRPAVLLDDAVVQIRRGRGCSAYGAICNGRCKTARVRGVARRAAQRPLASVFSPPRASASRGSWFKTRAAHATTTCAPRRPLSFVQGVGAGPSPPRAFRCFSRSCRGSAACPLRASSRNATATETTLRRANAEEARPCLSANRRCAAAHVAVSHAEREKVAIGHRLAWAAPRQGRVRRREGQCSDPQGPVLDTFRSAARVTAANVWFEPSEGLERRAGPPPEAFAQVHFRRAGRVRRHANAVRRPTLCGGSDACAGGKGVGGGPPSSAPAARCTRHATKTRPRRIRNRGRFYEDPSAILPAGVRRRRGLGARLSPTAPSPALPLLLPRASLPSPSPATPSLSLRSRIVHRHRRRRTPRPASHDAHSHTGTREAQSPGQPEAAQARNSLTAALAAAADHLPG